MSIRVGARCLRTLPAYQIRAADQWGLPPDLVVYFDRVEWLTLDPPAMAALRNGEIDCGQPSPRPVEAHSRPRCHCIGNMQQL
jgi:hypothetical protein